MRALGALAAILGLLFAFPTFGQDLSREKPSPSRDLPADSIAVAPATTLAATPAASPEFPAPLANPVRLDLTPRAASPEAPGIPDPEALSSSLRRGARAGDNKFEVWGRYNRVEGPAVLASVTRRLDRKSYLPSYRIQFGYAFSAERGQYRVGFEQPVAPRNKLTVGAEGYRTFAPFFYADEALSSGENSASALLLHQDYWDWYEAEGVKGFLGIRPSPFLQVTFGLLRQDEASLGNHADWSLFNQEADFPDNPSVPEGEYRGAEATVVFDTRPRDDEGEFRPRGAWSSLEHWHRLSWERGDGGLGGDFDLWRLTADLRNYLRLAPSQVLSTRILAGTGDAGLALLPAGRRFEIGGLGTLRGHLYRSLAGDHVALANVQYAIGVGHRGWLLFFADAGTAWDQGGLFDQRVPVDLGTGFRIGHSGPTLLVARTLSESDAEVRVQFRFQESF